MKVGILGSDAVGVALAKGLIAEGHIVWLATRDPHGDKAMGLQDDVPEVTVCDFETAAREGELVVFCVKWTGARDAMKAAGAQNLAGKVVIDTSNPIAPSDNGVSITANITDSAGELVQEWTPESSVVKAFNSVGADLMYKPKFDTRPTMFIAGNDPEAKQQVSGIVESFGWEVLDAGDVTAARELEALAVLWINHTIKTKDRDHAFKMLP